MKIYKGYLTKNRCYLKGAKFSGGVPRGIVVHSTGCVNKLVTRYSNLVALGKVSENHWNKSNISKCVNAILGWSTTLNDVVVVRTLPDSYKPWGCASGKNGSYNNSHYQFEICEGSSEDSEYFTKVYKLAVEYVASLCKQYDIPVSLVVSHAEAHKKGYASDHNDADAYFKKFGKSMDIFRSDVKKVLNQFYTVEVTAKSGLNVRNYPSVEKGIKTTTLAKGEKVEIKAGTERKLEGLTWGQLVKGGWIALDFTKK